jgi:hypothetical protein
LGQKAVLAETARDEAEHGLSVDCAKRFKAVCLRSHDDWVAAFGRDEDVAMAIDSGRRRRLSCLCDERRRHRSEQDEEAQLSKSQNGIV